MNSSGWLQLVLFAAALLLTAKPLGLYLCKVLDADGKTFLDPMIRPLERLTYALTGVDPKKEQDWKGYAIADRKSLNLLLKVKNLRQHCTASTYVQ